MTRASLTACVRFGKTITGHNSVVFCDSMFPPPNPQFLWLVKSWVDNNLEDWWRFGKKIWPWGEVLDSGMTKVIFWVGFVTPRSLFPCVGKRINLDSRMGTVYWIYPWGNTRWGEIWWGVVLGRLWMVCFLGGSGEGKRNSRVSTVEAFS